MTILSILKKYTDEDVKEWYANLIKELSQRTKEIDLNKTKEILVSVILIPEKK